MAELVFDFVQSWEEFVPNRDYFQAELNRWHWTYFGTLFKFDRDWSIYAVRVITAEIHHQCHLGTPSLYFPCLITILCKKIGIQVDENVEEIVAPQDSINRKQLEIVQKENEKYKRPDGLVLEDMTERVHPLSSCKSLCLQLK
ncbi:hypothetical protein ACH5RR_037420 [Cinchona calisaya]|uniref:Uncharacterized protein n=1 Tax=Cinchona calisaya TaxID=153742 RepID=A0ABD2Y638_9GENT